MTDRPLAGNAEVEVCLRWISEDACHVERLFIEKFNFWRDIVPRKLVLQMDGWKEGETIRESFEPGELVPKRSEDLMVIVPRNQVATTFEGHPITLIPGAFSPMGIAAKALMVFPQDIRPMQIISVTEDKVAVDLNHPLAGLPLELSMYLHRFSDTEGASGGRCNEIVESITSGGPGMQALFDAPTSCIDGSPLRRVDEGDDARFYESPRLVQHLDAQAERQVSRLYGKLIPEGAEILDLMTSWNSHLPETLGISRVVGLGMNEEELRTNPALSSYTLQDLNTNPVLPFADEAFHAVICTSSVEYAIHPVPLFKEVARVLKPRGVFIVTFSDRWFPLKVTLPWPQITSFEHMGLVLEYFRAAGDFTEYHTESMRGWPRPTDDTYFPERQEADPLLAVWGTKSRPPAAKG